MNFLNEKNIPLNPKSMAQLQTIYDFVNKDIKYVSDIAGIETLHTAEFILQNQYGDCDDKSILSASMLKTLGYTVAIVFLDVLGSYDYQHIYIMVEFQNMWWPFDTCIEGSSSGVGAEVKTYKRRKIMPIY